MFDAYDVVDRLWFGTGERGTTWVGETNIVWLHNRDATSVNIYTCDEKSHVICFSAGRIA
jgi:hypothetical protein